MPRLPFSLLLALSVCVASPLGISKEGDSPPAKSLPAKSLPAKSLPAKSLPAVVGLQAEMPADGPYVETSQGFMVPYALAIPGRDVEFEMVPVPGGTFLLGSADGEAGRNADEGPQVQISVLPFWIGKYEVTWAEYKEFMRLYSQFKQIEQLRGQFATRDGESPELPEALRQATHLAEHLNKKPSFVDGVTCPTPLYDPDATYESGEDPRQPAVTMTPYSAKQYTKWLSQITGHSYRLPSEAEWEYAARAGTATAFSFGDDPAQLADHAWFAENSEDRSQNVGEKAPNAWGLYDMHGNVAELVLDQYSADAFERLQKNQPVAAADAVLWPTDPHERVVRGGSWLDEPELLRSAARMVTDDVEWKMSDPNLPLSPWWYTELYPAGGVGFRLVRSLVPMSDEMAERAWEIDAPSIRFDVEARLDEGRGALEITPPELPTVLEELKRRDVQKLLEQSLKNVAPAYPGVQSGRRRRATLRSTRINAGKGVVVGGGFPNPQNAAHGAHNDAAAPPSTRPPAFLGVFLVLAALPRNARRSGWIPCVAWRRGWPWRRGWRIKNAG